MVEGATPSAPHLASIDFRSVAHLAWPQRDPFAEERRATVVTVATVAVPAVATVVGGGGVAHPHRGPVDDGREERRHRVEPVEPQHVREVERPPPDEEAACKRRCALSLREKK